MDVREKLVELLAGCPCESDCEEMVGSCPNRKNGNCNEIFKLSYCAVSKLAQHLIAHGVTAQELNGCEYCKEDSEGYRKMIGAFLITNPFHGNVWNIETCHCKPRQIYFCPMCGRRLPQLPKGE